MSTSVPATLSSSFMRYQAATKMAALLCHPTEHCKNPWARECSTVFSDVGECFSLGTVKPKLRWHLTFDIWHLTQVTSWKWKFFSKIQRNVMDLNKLLSNVIGSLTLWLAQRRSIENRTNHVASLGTKPHLIIFSFASFKAYSNINTKIALKYLFHAVRWNPQVQSVSKATCSTWLQIFPENSTVSGKIASLFKT